MLDSELEVDNDIRKRPEVHRRRHDARAACEGYRLPDRLHGELRECLASAWTLTEFPRETPRKRLLEMFQRAVWTHDGEHSLAHRPVPTDQYTLYRGVGTARPAASRGLSWTTNFATAQWFARRFEGMGVVYQAIVPGARIYANFTGRNEGEYIADVRGLKLERIS